MPETPHPTEDTKREIESVESNSNLRVVVYNPIELYKTIKTELKTKPFSWVTLSEDRLDDELYDRFETVLDVTNTSFALSTTLGISPEQRFTKDLGIFTTNRIDTIKQK